MIGKALLLLADVELLDVVDHLLLQAVLVVLHVGDGGQPFHDALAYLLHALFLVGFDAGQQSGDVVQLLLDLLLQSLALLPAECHELVDGRLHDAASHLPLFFRKFLLCLSAQEDVRHADERVPVVVRLGDVILRRDVLHLAVVGGHKLGIDGTGRCLVLLFRPEIELHLAALQGLRYHGPHLHFLLAIGGRHTCRKVESLTVERLHLCYNLFSLVFGRGFAVTGHR